MNAEKQTDLVLAGQPGKRRLKELFVGTTVERVVRFGDRPVLMVNEQPNGPPPSTEIALYAGKTKAAFWCSAMVSEDGSSSFGSFSAGRILRSAVAPGLVVKARCTGDYRRAVVGVDLSPFSERAAVLAAQLVPKTGIVMVHASSNGRVREEDVASGSEARRPKLEEFVDTLQRHRGGADGAKSLYPAHIREGEVQHVLKEEVRNAGADLLGLGTHGRSGLSRALFGSVPRKCLSQCLAIS